MSPKKVKELTEKKYRTETGLFMVEGEKNIKELLTSDFTIVALHGTRPFLNIVESKIHAYEQNVQDRIELIENTEAQLVGMGTFMTNNAGVAVARQKEPVVVSTILEGAQNDFVLVLDEIRDPGNLGTIIRIADWYGIKHIIASVTSVDCYNSKVITASMGSFTRVSVTYLELSEVLEEAQKRILPILIGDMDGENIHSTPLPKHGLLLMGSESHGISEAVRGFASTTLSIPRFGKAESLNVSVATGILLDALRRSH
jgi:TrmH family RNA methyltransferase